MADRAARLVAAPGFQKLVIGMILFSGLLLGLETSQSVMAQYGPWLHFLDRLVIGFFVAEIALKVAAHGRRPWDYFRDAWNVIDTVIVAICLVPAGSNAAAIFRLIRVLRVLRLVTALPKLQLVVTALIKSIPSMTSVVALLGLHFYIFSVLGVFVFGPTDPENFGSLGVTVLSLFQVLTLEGWVDLMKAQMVAHPVGAVLYFISFIVLGTMIILNLLIGVVVNGMAESQTEIEGRVEDKIDDSIAALTAEIRDLRGELRQWKERETSGRRLDL